MLFLRLILALPLAVLAVYEGTLTVSAGSGGIAAAGTTNVTPPPPWRPKSGAAAGPYASPTQELSIKSRSPRARWTYDWPMKPFNGPHPVRAYLNDPRVSMFGETHTFHFGVDISARGDTAIYAIEPGTAHLLNKWAVEVKSGDRTLQYWHIAVAVKNGQRVRRHTLLGRTRMIFNHLHLTEVQGGKYVNPLRPGGLGPFADRTAPRTTKVTFRRPGARLDPNAVHGTVDLVADAFDPASGVTPAPWPVTPAKLRWRIFKGQKVVAGWHLAVDFRTRVLSAHEFGGVYAPGTRMNHPGWPGYYCLYLAHGWSSASVPNGNYRLEVAASDIRGNVGISIFPFTVAN
jgi:murein DD-endopeptidase MepM/ murein hydrolase activator NlpD